MASENETNSESTDGDPEVGGDTVRVEMIKEIAELSKIPGIAEHFLHALLEAKTIFQDKIREFQPLKDNIEKESAKEKPEEVKEEVLPELSKAFEKSKTYFFELTRVHDPATARESRWEVGKFKLKNKADGKVVDTIFDDFIKKVDQYDVTPHRIQDEIVDVRSLQKKFQISFTRSSPTRVVGFVKEAKTLEEIPGEKGKDERAKKRFVVRDNRNMLKLASTAENRLDMDKEELEELMQNNQEFMNSIYFTLRMKQACNRAQ